MKKMFFVVLFLAVFAIPAVAQEVLTFTVKGVQVEMKLESVRVFTGQPLYQKGSNGEYQKVVDKYQGPVLVVNYFLQGQVPTNAKWTEVLVVIQESQTSNVRYPAKTVDVQGGRVSDILALGFDTSKDNDFRFPEGWNQTVRQDLLLNGELLFSNLIRLEPTAGKITIEPIGVAYSKRLLDVLSSPIIASKAK